MLFGLLITIQPARAELVAHFPLDNDGIDVVSGFEGDVGDGVSFVPNGGVIGGAAEFEGFGGIQLEYEEALNPEENFSVTAWVNPIDTTSWNSVITSRSHVDDPAGQYITGYIIYNSPENNWDFWTGGGGVPGSWGRNIGPPAELDEWQHLAITYDGSTDTKTLYVNGAEEATVSGQGYVANPNLPLTIGAGGDVGTEFFFIGLIDDLSIWNETLDEATIQLIMTEGVAAAVGGGTPGDFNNDGLLTAIDIDALTAEILAGGKGAAFDVNKDGDVTGDDRVYWVNELKKTYMGDANLDLEFNSKDLVEVLAAGQYEDAILGNSTWATGDFNGDADVTSADLVEALAGGGYELGPRQAVNAVPEPAGLTLLLVAICGFRFITNSPQRTPRSPR
jgi:hypothetical protein